MSALKDNLDAANRDKPESDPTRVFFACPKCGLPDSMPQWLVSHSGAPYCAHDGHTGLGLDRPEHRERWTRMVPFEDIYVRREETGPSEPERAAHNAAVARGRTAGRPGF